MLTLLGGAGGVVVGRGAAGRGARAAGGSGGAGWVVGRSGVVGADRRAHWRRRGARRRAVVGGMGGRRSRWRRYVRLMVVKQRYRLGLRDAGAGGVGLDPSAPVLSDRADERVPDESTVRKLTRRLGRETVDEITRVLIAKARREKRFRARAVRVDSTVIEADVATRPTRGSRCRARGRWRGRVASWRRWSGSTSGAVRDRSRAMGRSCAAIYAHDPAPLGEAKRRGARADRARPGELLEQVDQGGAAARGHRPGARRAGRGAQAKLQAAAQLEQLADRCEKVAAADHASASRANRSPTGSSRSPIPTPGRSARASSASRTSSATSTSWPR